MKAAPAMVPVLLVLLWSILFPASLRAQYMYLDANGDGVWTTADVLNVPGVTHVDIWLSTDHNKDGSSVVCPTGQSLTINSYTFLLRAVGGTVNWGPYVNNQTVMGVDLGTTSTPTSQRSGHLGSTVLSAGTYKLGSVDVFVTSGKPHLEIAAQDSMGQYVTTFGSACAGHDADNTLKLGQDWIDADGIAAASSHVAFGETFDHSTFLSSVWSTFSNSSTNSTVWDLSYTGCGYVLGTHSATGAGCGSYFSGIDNELTLWEPEYVSQLLNYKVSFVERHNLVPEDQNFADQLEFAYDTGSNPSDLSLVDNLAFTGNQASWVRITGTSLDNSSFQNAYVQPHFGLQTYHDSPSGTYGAWIDSVQVFGPARPDLIVQSASLPTSGLVAGTPATLNYTIFNAGDMTTSVGYSIRVRMVGVGVGVTDTVLTTRSYSALAASSSTSDNITFTLTRSGTYRIGLDLDYGGAVTESAFDDSAETNNAYVSSTTYAWAPQPRPDLVVTIGGPATASEGKPFRIPVTVTNTSQTTSAGQFKLGWFGHRGTAPQVGTTPDDSVTITSLGALQSVVDSFTVTSNVARTDTMYAVADFRGAVVEANENNNVSSRKTVAWVPRAIVVRGKFQYSDSLLGTWTTPCNFVELYDWDSTKTDTLGIVSVEDTSGKFEFPAIVNDDDVDHGFLDLWVRVIYQSDEACWNSAYRSNIFIRMQMPNDSTWHWDSVGYTNANPSNDTLDVGTLYPTAPGHREVLHMQWAITAYGWGLVRNNTDPAVSIAPVGVHYYPGQYVKTGTNDNGRIDINGEDDFDKSGPDPWDNSVVLHEYGHHIASFFRFAVGDTFEHQIDKPAHSEYEAWDEGWGDFFGVLRGGDVNASGYGIYADYGRAPWGTKYLSYWNAEADTFIAYYPDLFTVADHASTLHGGPWVEGSIAGALWDIYDTTVDPPAVGRYGDTVSDGFGQIWRCLTDSTNTDKIRTVNDFVAAYEKSFPYPFNQDYAHHLQEIHEVFLDHGIYDGRDDSVIAGIDPEAGSGVWLRMLGAAPNPFNPETRIRFAVGSRVIGGAKIHVFDAAGRLVRTLEIGKPRPGLNAVEWDGRSRAGTPVGSGVYFCEIEYGNLRQRAKMVLIR